MAEVHLQEAEEEEEAHLPSPSPSSSSPSFALTCMAQFPSSAPESPHHGPFHPLSPEIVLGLPLSDDDSLVRLPRDLIDKTHPFIQDSADEAAHASFHSFEDVDGFLADPSCQSHRERGCGSIHHRSSDQEGALSTAICASKPCIHGGSTSGQLEEKERESTNGSRLKPKPDVHKPARKCERGRLSQNFQHAVDDRDWKRAENLIRSADVQRLNDGLCIVLDSVWFLSTHEDIYGAIRVMERLVDAGAQDFTRAAQRTSFLASCVSACWSRSFSIADMVALLEERLSERLQECSGHEMSKGDAASVQQFTEWALKYIHSHSRSRTRGPDGSMLQLGHNTSAESQLQLRAFKRFLELAGNWLTGNDYTESFDAACYPLTLFATSIDAGWAFSIASVAMQGLLGMLVEGGADNVNQCCLEAARYGSTDLLRILLQIAQRNGIEVDVDLALEYASQFCKVKTMECLVDEWNVSTFLGPLMRAADRGCMPVVKWFVERGCREFEICSALVAATSSGRYEVADYIIKCIPQHVMQMRSMDILRATAERSGGCLKGVAFLLQSNFLGQQETTYAVADTIAKLEDGSISTELKSFCMDQWSAEAFIRGQKAGEVHYSNVVRVLCHGSHLQHLQELPLELRVAIAYLPLYKECITANGPLLSQCLRGQLVEAVSRLGGKCEFTEELLAFDKYKLLSMLESKLPSFFVGTP